MKPTVSESRTFLFEFGKPTVLVVVDRVVKSLGDYSFDSEASRLKRVVLPLLV